MRLPPRVRSRIRRPSPPAEHGQLVRLDGTVEQRVYQGVNTQVTVSLGDGARLVALEQNTYQARSDDRWEPGTKVKIGWHPEHCLVLR